MDSSMSSNSISISTRKKAARVYGKNRDVPLATHETNSCNTSSNAGPSSSTYADDDAEGVDIDDPFGLKRSLRNIEDNFDEPQEQFESASTSKSSLSIPQDDLFDVSMDIPSNTPFSGSLTPLSSQDRFSQPSQHNHSHSHKHNSLLDSFTRENNAQSSPISPDPFSMDSPARSTSSSPTSSPIFENNNNTTKSHSKSLLEDEYEADTAISSSKGKGKAKMTPKKRSNKKTLEETHVENSGIRIERSSFFPAKGESLPMTAFFQKMKPNATPCGSPSNKLKEPSSDPIQSFTSPDSSAPSKGIVFKNTAGEQDDVKLDDEEDFMPDASRLLHEISEKKKNKEVIQKLNGEKRRILEMQLNAKDVEKSDDDNDDLEIVDNMLSSSPPSAGELRKIRLNSSTIKAKMPKTDMSDSHNFKEFFETAAKPHFGQQSSRSARDSLSHKDLGSLTFRRAMQQSKEITKRKEDEWVHKGGKLKNKILADRGEMNTLQSYEKKRVEQGDESHEGDESSAEEGDSDWSPSNRQSNDSDEENINERPSVMLSSPPSGNITDTDNDIFGGPAKGSARHFSRRLTRVVDSDDDNGENMSPESRGRILVADTSIMDEMSLDVYNQAWNHRGSASSLDVPSMDEDNKENDGRLMYDQSEDKENTALPRHLTVDFNDQRPPIRRSGSSLGGLEEGFRRRLSMSPSIENHSPERQPFGELDGSSVGIKPPTEDTQVSNTRLRLPQSRSQTPSPKASNVLQPAFGDELLLNLPSSDDEDGLPSSLQRNSNLPKPLSSPSSPVLMQLGGLSQLFSSEEEITNGFNLSNSDVQELSLTMDVRLQPALEISSQIRRQGDAIFEKEQDFLLEEANQSKKANVPDLYITEAGLLTQTRPEDSTPVVYRHISATQDSDLKSQWEARYQLSQRQPLGTLSFTSDTSSPSQQRGLSRLVKGSRPEIDHRMDSEAGPSDLTNAFQLMLKAARKEKSKHLVKKSEFIEGEAQESDEDEMLGFIRKTEEDEDENEDEDEDPNVNLAELLDDKQMDIETLAAEKVQEKFQEHQALDDAEIEKLHQAAVAGKLKSKRRGGRIGFDDSEEEDSDDEARRVRARMFKKRKIDGDIFETLGEESQSFKAAYQKDLDDDAGEDFAHLNQDAMDVENDSENEDDDNDEDRPRTYSEMTKKLREIARSNEARKEFDPDDVSWTGFSGTQDDEELRLHVKEVDSRLKKISDHRESTRRQTDDDLDLERFMRPSNPKEQERLASWQKENGSSSRTFASSSGAAVTGHGQSKTARPSRQNDASAGESERHKSMKSASILASITDKQSRFE